MKTKYNKRRYKLQYGIQEIQSDSSNYEPDYSTAFKIKEEAAAKKKVGESLAATVANIAMPGLGSAMQGAGAISDAVFKDAKGNYKNKTSEVLANQLNPLGQAGNAFSALTGDKGAAAELWSGSLIGGGLGALGMKNPFGKTTSQKVKEEAQKAEEEAKKQKALADFNKLYTSAPPKTATQSFIAKKGKYKVKSKEPRLIETEGREPIFSPKKKDGSRDLLYYNPNDPTHEEGGVKAVVMPRRPASKYSLVGSGKMAYGAKQVKVNDLNNTAFSQNLTGMPSANVANKFVQPTTGIHQVARQVEENRRKEKIRTPRSHKKENPDTNRIIDPPMLYEMKPPPPRSTFNTKNDFNKGSKRVKVYR